MESASGVQTLFVVHTSQVERCVVGPQPLNTDVPRCLGGDSVVSTFSKMRRLNFFGEFQKGSNQKKFCMAKLERVMKGVVHTVIVSSATP